MHLPAPVVLVLGIIGGILEIVQRLAITMSTQAHTIVGFVIIVILAVGVIPLGAEALRRLIPNSVAAVLTSIAGIIAAVVHTFGVSNVIAGIIYFVLAFLAAIGIVPAALSIGEVRAQRQAALR